MDKKKVVAISAKEHIEIIISLLHKFPELDAIFLKSFDEVEKIYIKDSEEKGKENE